MTAEERKAKHLVAFQVIHLDGVWTEEKLLPSCQVIHMSEGYTIQSLVQRCLEDFTSRGYVIQVPGGYQTTEDLAKRQEMHARYIKLPLSIRPDSGVFADLQEALDDAEIATGQDQQSKLAEAERLLKIFLEGEKAAGNLEISPLLPEDKKIRQLYINAERRRLEYLKSHPTLDD